MNTDPAQIRADVESLLADLPPVGPDAHVDGAATAETDAKSHIDSIEAAGRRLEQAHQMLVNALELVEKS